MSMTFAIVGRPNVGKSTLFNRLTGRQHAIVDDQPGVTRDRREGDATLAGLSFRVIDTAGLEDAEQNTLEDRMRRQTEMAIRQADVTMLMIDARTGVTPIDKFFASEIRKSGANVILLANKCEGKAGVLGIAEGWSLGLGEPVPISAVHGEGLVDLHDALLESARDLGMESTLIGGVSTYNEAEDKSLDYDEKYRQLKVKHRHLEWQHGRLTFVDDAPQQEDAGEPFIDRDADESVAKQGWAAIRHAVKGTKAQKLGGVVREASKRDVENPVRNEHHISQALTDAKREHAAHLLKIADLEDELRVSRLNVTPERGDSASESGFAPPAPSPSPRGPPAPPTPPPPAHRTPGSPATPHVDLE